MAVQLTPFLFPFSKKPPLLSSSSSPSLPILQRIMINFHPIRDLSTATATSSSARRINFHHIHCLSTASTTSSSPAVRRTANYKPTIWDDSYIQSLQIDFMEEKYMYRREKLMEEVRFLINQQHSLTEQLELVDTLCQLGLGYHFDAELKNLLSSISSSKKNINNLIENNNLHDFALLFRLVREHDIHNASILRLDDLISCFKNEEESFNQNNQLDVKGMLNLYEASFLAMEGEDELDEAGKFAMKHLKYHDRSLLSPQLVEQIEHALELPLHWRMSRLHTRWFIDAYGRHKNFNPTLLEFAKLDFNMVQSIYKTELQELSRWWRNINVVRGGLNFVRDRLVENYLWAIGFTFQPELWRIRKAMTQIISFITTIDDIYDIYGTLDELKLFTNAIEAWNIATTQQLPGYMKKCLTTLFNTMDDIASSFSKEKELDILPCLKRMWADLCKAYFIEAMWYHNGYTPTLDEYLDNAWVTISGICVLTATYCLSDDLTFEAIKSLEFYPPIVRYSCMLLRLYDDLGTCTEEIQRGDVPKSIQCYMKEKNVSETTARDYIRCLIRNYWKKLNKEHVISSKYVESFRKVLFDIPRTAQCFYQYGDGYGEPDLETREQIICIIIKPISL
ncbi:terpene synthase 10-like [Dendrobium catenatum]|uniref:Alpha-terpineol synthase, chloroplastic n=1 Tax=Dendrobium catenatum TaxID=906689 RepID=A0A2I0XCC3_9ASPA|nr:terpene synthase 10-like [Dendrobium catenatum]PKU85555.1 Alpha-terpineol synthase, chloroplastic [Dendrobium catenatum]